MATQLVPVEARSIIKVDTIVSNCVVQAMVTVLLLFLAALNALRVIGSGTQVT
jgi:hypothetical protein